VNLEFVHISVAIQFEFEFFLHFNLYYLYYYYFVTGDFIFQFFPPKIILGNSVKYAFESTHLYQFYLFKTKLITGKQQKMNGQVN